MLLKNTKCNIIEYFPAQNNDISLDKNLKIKN